MRRGKQRKFGRVSGQRTVLYRALSTALIEHGKIKTTEAKAKSLTAHIAKLITLAKKQTLASRRLVSAQIGDKATKKLMDEVAIQLKDKSLTAHIAKLITLAKKQTLASRRLVSAQIGDKATKKLMDEVAIQLKD